MPLLPTALIVHGQPRLEKVLHATARTSLLTQKQMLAKSESGYNTTATARAARAAAARFIHRQHAGKGTRSSQATLKRRAPSQEQEQASGQT
jgi:hypothetical protein